MPGIDLAALSGADLRRLLKVAHTRHDGLLSDRLEWEIADRAAHGNRAPTHFATPPDDDQPEPAFRMSADDREPDDTEPLAQAEPEPRARGVVLVTLGAVAGSLLSAAVFWGLERMDGLPSFGRAEPQAAVVAVAPAPLPQPAALDAPLPTSLVDVTPTQVAAAPAPARKPHRPARARASNTLTVASAGRASRPPNLSEWLSGKPEEPIY